MNTWIFSIWESFSWCVFERSTFILKILSGELSSIPFFPGHPSSPLVAGHCPPHMRGNHEPPAWLPVPHNIKIAHPSPVRNTWLGAYSQNLPLPGPAQPQVRTTHWGIDTNTCLILTNTNQELLTCKPCPQGWTPVLLPSTCPLHAQTLSAALALSGTLSSATLLHCCKNQPWCWDRSYRIEYKTPVITSLLGQHSGAPALLCVVAGGSGPWSCRWHC